LLGAAVLCAAGLLAASVLAGTPAGAVESTGLTEPPPSESAPAEPTVTAPTEPAPTEPAPTEPAPTEPAPSTPAPSTEPLLPPLQPTPPPKPKPKPVAKPKPKPKPKLQPLRLASRVTIGGIHVGGLRLETAYQVVRAAFGAPLVVRVEGRRLEVSPPTLGAVAYARTAVTRARHARAGTDVPLVVRVSGPAVRRYVTSLAKRFDRKPVDARVLLRSLEPVVVDGQSGLALARRPAATKLVAALEANRRRPIVIPARPVRPAVAKIGPIVLIRRDSKRLFFYENEKLERTFVVATGQTSYPTPLGRFSIVAKWRNPWWYPPQSSWAKGLSPVPPGPGNPLGTRWMGISAPAVGIHGTPDEASLGYSLSHGCVRMAIPSAEWLFDHVDVGTPVFILAV
jgi:lipoprotein-anchoring transpeptidase ErfK/SrfK